MHPLDQVISRIEAHIRDRRPYKAQAYLFVLGALEFTLDKLGRKGKPETPEAVRHVSGQELSYGIKDYAVAQFGPTARMVLDNWGIKTTSDFGRIVYDLIDLKLLGKNEQDKIEDFDNVFNLDQELIDNYRFKLDKRG
jgi:uncharacterized repeat protein (TIGR04138 family)